METNQRTLQSSRGWQFLFLGVAVVLLCAGLAVLFRHETLTFSDFSSSPFLIIVIILVGSYVARVKSRPLTKRQIVWVVIFSLCFSFAYTVGVNIYQTGFSRITAPKTLVVWLALTPFLIFSFGRAFLWLDSSLKKRSARKTLPAIASWPFWTILLIILLCWLPFFLAYLPGIWGVDTIWETRWLKGTYDLTAHYTLIHTLWLSGSVWLSQELFGTTFYGALVYTVIQMFIYAGALAEIVKHLARWNVPRALPYLALAFYCFFPMFANYSVVMTKDIVFSSFFGLTVLLTVEMIRTPPKRYFAKKSNLVKLGVVLFLTVMLRNNTAYGMLIFLPFCVVLLRDHWKQVLAVFGIPTILFFIIIGPLHSAWGISNGYSRESMSVPAVQMANAAIEEDLTDEQMKFVETYDPEWQKYNPVLADPVKNPFQGDLVLSDIGGFLKQYISLGLEYPRAYTDAFLRLTVGFWCPWTDYSVGNTWVNTMYPWYNFQYKISENYPEDEFVFVDHISLLPSFESFLAEMRDIRPETNIPIVSQLCQGGVWVWVILFAACYYLAMKRYRRLVPILFILCYLFTAMLGPLSGIRYALPFAVTFVIILGDLLGARVAPQGARVPPQGARMALRGSHAAHTREEPTPEEHTREAHSNYSAPHQAPYEAERSEKPAPQSAAFPHEAPPGKQTPSYPSDSSS